MLPENLGLSDEGLNAGIARYNEMVLRRGKLLQSASESNPIVIGLNTQLQGLKKNIQETIANVESGLLICAELDKEGALVYQMTSYGTVISPCPAEASFALPNGDILYTR